MFHKLSFWLKISFLSIVTSSLIVACGEDAARRRPQVNKANVPAKPGTTTGGQTGGGTTVTDQQNTQTDSTNTNNQKVVSKDEKAVGATASTQTAPVGTVEQIARLNDIDLLLTSENQKGKKDIWKSKSKLVTDKLTTLSLEKIAGNNGKNRYSVVAIAKVMKDNNTIADRLELQTENELSIDDLAKDVELTNFRSDAQLSVDDLKKNLGKVELRFMAKRNEYLLQIIGTDGAEAAIVFDQAGKMVQVLGQELESDALIKKLSRSTSSSEKNLATASQIKSANEILKIVDASIVSKPQLLEIVKDQREILINLPSKIIADIEGIRTTGINILKGQSLGDNNSVAALQNEMVQRKGITKNNIDALKKSIASTLVILNQQVAKVGVASDDGKFIQEQLIAKLTSIKIDDQQAEEPVAAGAALKLPGKLETTH